MARAEFGQLLVTVVVHLVERLAVGKAGVVFGAASEAKKSRGQTARQPVNKLQMIVWIVEGKPVDRSKLANSTGLETAADLRHHFFRILNVFEHVHAHYDVEICRGKRQRFARCIDRSKV